MPSTENRAILINYIFNDNILIMKYKHFDKKLRITLIFLFYTYMKKLTKLKE